MRRQQMRMEFPARSTATTMRLRLWTSARTEFPNPLADTDGDGMKDAAEVVAGTDATAAASMLKLSMNLLPQQNAVALRWPPVAGRSYTVRRASSLTQTGVWQVVTENLSGNGSMMECHDDTMGTAEWFYRLEVEMQ